MQEDVQDRIHTPLRHCSCITLSNSSFIFCIQYNVPYIVRAYTFLDITNTYMIVQSVYAYVYTRLVALLYIPTSPRVPFCKDDSLQRKHSFHSHFRKTPEANEYIFVCEATWLGESSSPKVRVIKRRYGTTLCAECALPYKPLRVGWLVCLFPCTALGFGATWRSYSKLPTPIGILILPSAHETKRMHNLFCTFSHHFHNPRDPTFLPFEYALGMSFVFICVIMRISPDARRSYTKWDGVYAGKWETRNPFHKYYTPISIRFLDRWGGEFTLYFAHREAGTTPENPELKGLLTPSFKQLEFPSRVSLFGLNNIILVVRICIPAMVYMVVFDEEVAFVSHRRHAEWPCIGRVMKITVGNLTIHFR